MVGRSSALHSSAMGVIGPQNQQHQQMGNQNGSLVLGFDLNFPPTMVVPPAFNNQFTSQTTLHVPDQGSITFPPLFQGGSTDLPPLPDSLLSPLSQTFLPETLHSTTLPLAMPSPLTSTQMSTSPSYMPPTPRMIKLRSEEVGDAGVFYMLFPNDRFGLVYAEYSARLGCSRPCKSFLFRINNFLFVCYNFIMLSFWLNCLKNCSKLTLILTTFCG